MEPCLDHRQGVAHEDVSQERDEWLDNLPDAVDGSAKRREELGDAILVVDDVLERGAEALDRHVEALAQRRTNVLENGRVNLVHGIGDLGERLAHAIHEGAAEGLERLLGLVLDNLPSLGPVCGGLERAHDAVASAERRVGQLLHGEGT